MACNSKNRGQALIEMIIYATVVAGFFILAVTLSRTMSHSQEASRFMSTPRSKSLSGLNP